MNRSTVHWLANLTVGFMLLLIAIGGYTRGSGTDGAVLWMAVLVGLAAIVIVYVSWRLRLDHRWVLLPAVATVVAIGIQAWLGWLHVSGDPARDLVLIHLFVSLTIVGLLVIVAVSTRPALDGPNLLERDWSRQLGIGAFAVFIVLLLGSMVHDVYFAGGLLVNGEWAPNLTEFNALTIHWAHRMASAAVLVYLLFLVWRGAHVERPRSEGYLVIGATVLYIVNVGVGLLQVWTEASSSVMVALHLGLGAAAWAALIAATFLSFHDPR